MSLPVAHQVFPAELEDHLSGADGADDVCIDICNCVAGDFERKRPALRLFIILSEFLKVIAHYMLLGLGTRTLAT